MGQWTTKRPRGVTRIGEKVLQYLWRTSREGLRYQRLGAGDYGPDHQQHRERRRDAVEAYADASFGAHEHKSISGLAVYYSGCPVFWATTRQACIALSTAESELAALIEAWTALRGVGGLVEELEEKPAELRLYSDSSAALAIVNESSGSWRTRHLRIRAAALSEAVADGFTKQLGASPFGRFKESLGFYGGAVESGESPVEVVKVKKMESSRDRRLEKVLGLLVVASTCVELTEAKEMDLGEEGGGYWWLVVIVAVVILLKLVKELGVVALRNCVRKEEELRFQRTCAEAVMPERPTESSAGVNLFAVNRVVVPAESYTLVRTGVKAQLPRGTCGRITTVASLALRGVETGSAVIERDFRGEVRILVRNHGPQDYVIEPEEAVAQLVLEKVSWPRSRR